MENVVLEREHGVPRTLSCVLYCIESEFEQIIRKTSLSIKDNN